VTFDLLQVFVKLRQVCVLEEVEVLRGVEQEFSSQPFVQLVLARRTQADALKKIRSKNQSTNLFFLLKATFLQRFGFTIARPP
jgi:hypothetical protein